MALNAYLKLITEDQGQIRGSVTQKGLEDTIMVMGVHHEVVRQYDRASGKPQGALQYKPIIITKQVDRATPNLYKALAHNETIVEFTLSFYATSATGPSRGYDTNHFKISLVNAYILEIEFNMHNNLQEEGKEMPLLENIHVGFEKIIWEWVDDKIVFEHHWGSDT